MTNYKILIIMFLTLLFAGCTEEEDPAIPPVADFTGTQDGRTFSFVNLSTDASSYLWDFGDGIGTSTEEDPTYTYALTDDEFKDYVVSLTATGPGGSDEIAYTVSVGGRVTASFEYSPDEPLANQEISFTNISVNAVSYSWDFGDGTASTDRNPTHSYNTAGDFNVKLTVEGMPGTESPDDTTMVISVAAPEVIAAFEVSNNQIQILQSVTFTNNSENAESYLWDFGDGNTSTLKDPTHVYLDTGNYEVSLKVTGYGVEKKVTNIIDIIPPPPTAGFNVSADMIIVGETITFTGATEWIETYSWDFGDGNVFSAQTVEFSFPSSGFYDVSLTVTNETGSNTFSRQIEVIINPSTKIYLTDVIINDMPFQLADKSFFELPESGVNFTDGTMDIIMYLGTAAHFNSNFTTANSVSELYLHRSDFVKTADNSEDFPQSFTSFFDIAEGKSLNLEVLLTNEEWRFDTWETGVNNFFSEIHHAGDNDGDLELINPYRTFGEVNILGLGEYTTTLNTTHNNDTGTSITFKYRHALFD